MLQEVMDHAGLAEQMKWDLFYHQSISVQEVIASIVQAEALCEDTVSISPITDNCFNSFRI